MPTSFDLYMDYSNVIFLFHTLALIEDWSQSSLRKVLRSAVKLSVYNYTCDLVKCKENVWADLLSAGVRFQPLCDAFSASRSFPRPLTMTSSG